ncbi:c-type cytochrome, methanol metabolism-related [Rhizobium sp. KAs_5_22]|uniref:c-type cytochrome, methanol metabolism-related n=1 Tax=Ciceribacter selenitireducens TaxID=448181 RepID=UPI0004912519|nr:c-type cytochrome, methanol metabolism-related [Ciceribacter selenitireducens]PPJ44954.1 c-type cytochrome, methanol metabolism-related [Rhizobium sp. KAs_5_22]
MTRRLSALPTSFAALALFASAATAQDAAKPDNITAVTNENGRYYTADGVPTFNIAPDGTMDWMTYSGFRRYHSECHVCHGPEGEGSSYAPALKTSAIDLDYYAFVEVVTNGRKKVDASQNSVMPSFGQNANVMCYLDDIYTYLKARGSEALPRGRPGKKEPKSDAIRQAEADCLGN